MTRHKGDEAPPFVSKRQRTAFDEHVDQRLRENNFEPGLSPIAEKWTRMGVKTVLVARIHSWSPHLVEFYLEGPNERLIDAGRSNEQTFERELRRFIAMQLQKER